MTKRTNSLLARLAPAFVAYGIYDHLAPQLYLTSICQAFYPRLASGPGVLLADEVCQISAILSHYTFFELLVSLATFFHIYTTFKILSTSDLNGRAWGLHTCSILATVSVGVSLLTYTLRIPYPVYLVAVALKSEKVVLALAALYFTDNVSQEEERNRDGESFPETTAEDNSAGNCPLSIWPDQRLRPLVLLLIVRIVCKDWIGFTIGRVLEQSANLMVGMAVALALTLLFYMWTKDIPESRAIATSYLSSPKEYRDSKDTLYSPNSSVSGLVEQTASSPKISIMIVAGIVHMATSASLNILGSYISYMWDWRPVDLATISLGLSLSAVGGCIIGIPVLLPVIFAVISKVTRRDIKQSETNVMRVASLFTVAAAICCAIPNDVTFVVGLMVLSFVGSVACPHMTTYAIRVLGSECGPGYALALISCAANLAGLLGETIAPHLYAATFPSPPRFFAIFVVAYLVGAVVVFLLPTPQPAWLHYKDKDDHVDSSSETDTMSPELHSEDELSRSISPWSLQQSTQNGWKLR